MCQLNIKLIINIVLVCLTDAIPPSAPLSHRPPLQELNIKQQQNVETILLSIDERLHNFDQIYSIPDKFEQYQRKLDAIDMKINHLESLIMLNLDKISENISMKNFKDDISKTSFNKKIDGIYESFGQRLNYFERKFDQQTNKIHIKLDTIVNRLKQIEEGMIQRDEDIESELSDAIAAIDDLKTNSNLIEENIINTTQENYEIALKNQKSLLETHLNSSIMFKMLAEKNTENFEQINEKLITEIEIINNTETLIKEMKLELKEELNEYAVKVSDMNADNWKTSQFIQQQQINIETIINSTKIELQNGIRALIVLIGKNYNKNLTNKDKTQLDILNDKLDANFEKIFTAQNLFLDSCYRLQMDESQIESKISDILEKLMETFDKKTAVEIKDIINLEKSIKNHDIHIMSNLYQIGTNLITIYEKLVKDNQKFDTDLHRANQNLNALFAIVQNLLINENNGDNGRSMMTPNNLNTLYGKLEILINNSLTVLDEIKQISDNDKNFNQTLNRIETRFQTFSQYFYDNKNNTRSDNVENLNKNSTNLDDLIQQIFGNGFKKNSTITNGNQTKTTKCRQNYLNLIDVRMNNGDNEDNDCPPEEVNSNQIGQTTTKPQIPQLSPSPPPPQELDGDIMSVIDQIIMVDNALGLENGTTLEIMRVN